MLFDDVLGALDKRTARDLFRKVFSKYGLLRRMGVTAVLVTQSLHLASPTDTILLLSREGSIAYHGSLADMHPEKYTDGGLTLDDQEPERDWSKQKAPPKKLKSTVEVQTSSAEVTTALEKPKSSRDSALYLTYVNAIGKPFVGVFIALLLISAFCLNFSSEYFFCL